MKRILFIYGYGGSPESTFCRLIREELQPEQYEVVCPEYPQEDIVKTWDFFHNLLEREHYDIVMGTSLGAFITLSLQTGLPRIAINPCMEPSKELPALQPRKDHPEDKKPSAWMIEGYAKFEKDVMTGTFRSDAATIGLFAEDDELLGTRFKKGFKTYYETARSIPGGHHGNPEAIPEIVKAIKDVTRPILFVDMDNVLADFAGYVESHEELQDVKDVDETPGIFAKFPVVPGAKEALDRLQDKFELYILSTSPWNNPTALQDKSDWLKEYFGEMFHKHVIFTHRKDLCFRPGAWLVDDRPNHGAHRFGDHWLHFGKEGKFKTWDDVEEFLLKVPQ